jgi:hypothetical protein
VINSDLKTLQEVQEIESFGTPEEIEKITQFEKAAKEIYS